SLALTPNYDWVLAHVQVLVANGLAAEAMDRMQRLLPAYQRSDSPPGIGVIAHAAYVSVESARQAGLPRNADVETAAAALVDRASLGLDFAAQCSPYGHSTPV